MPLRVMVDVNGVVVGTEPIAAKYASTDVDIKSRKRNSQSPGIAGSKSRPQSVSKLRTTKTVTAPHQTDIEKATYVNCPTCQSMVKLSNFQKHSRKVHSKVLSGADLQNLKHWLSCASCDEFVPALEYRPHRSGACNAKKAESSSRMGRLSVKTPSKKARVASEPKVPARRDAFPWFGHIRCVVCEWSVKSSLFEQHIASKEHLERRKALSSERLKALSLASDPPIRKIASMGKAKSKINTASAKRSTITRASAGQLIECLHCTALVLKKNMDRHLRKCPKAPKPDPVKRSKYAPVAQRTGRTAQSSLVEYRGFMNGEETRFADKHLGQAIRDFNGAFGSIPLYDDYGEESWPD